MFDDWTYSPVKNSLEEAAGKLASGAPGRSATEGEFEYYSAAAHALRAAGVAVAAPAPFTAGGITVPRAAAIVVAPSFANSLSDWRARFPAPAAIAISARSALHVHGPGSVVFEALALDGALEVYAGQGARVVVRRLRVANEGVDFVPCAAGAAGVPDWQQIRAFVCVKKAVRQLRFPDAGDFVVDEA
jgi:hypothetical protein